MPFKVVAAGPVECSRSAVIVTGASDVRAGWSFNRDRRSRTRHHDLCRTSREGEFRTDAHKLGKEIDRGPCIVGDAAEWLNSSVIKRDAGA